VFLDFLIIKEVLSWLIRSILPALAVALAWTSVPLAALKIRVVYSTSKNLSALIAVPAKVPAPMAPSKQFNLRAEDITLRKPSFSLGGAEAFPYFTLILSVDTGKEKFSQTQYTHFCSVYSGNRKI